MERDPPGPPLWRRLAPLVGVALLMWVLSRLDADRLLLALSGVSAVHVAAAALLFSLSMLVKAWRWKRMLVAQQIAIPPKVCLATFLGAVFYGQFTIGRLGELYRVEALLERRVALGRAVSSCLFDRALDLYVVLATGAVLGALVFGETRAALWVGLLLAVVTLAGLQLALAGAGRGPASLRALAKGLETRAHGLPVVPRLLAGLRDLAAGVRPLLAPAPILEASLWTLLGWAGYFATLHILAAGMGIEVGPVLLIAAAALAATSSLLPITISGLGARELIYAELLGRHAVASESAVALALLHLTTMTGCAVVLGLIGLWVRSRQTAPIAKD